MRAVPTRLDCPQCGLTLALAATLSEYDAHAITVLDWYLQFEHLVDWTLPEGPSALSKVQSTLFLLSPLQLSTTGCA